MKQITDVIYNLMSVIRAAAIEDCCREICKHCAASAPYDSEMQCHIVKFGTRTNYVRCSAEKLKGKK